MILVIVSLSPIKAFWKGLTWSRTQVIWTYPFLHVFSPQGIFSDFRGFKCPKCKVKPFFILNSFWQFCYVLLPTEGLFVIANSIYNDWRPIQTYMMVYFLHFHHKHKASGSTDISHHVLQFCIILLTSKSTTTTKCSYSET